MALTKITTPELFDFSDLNTSLQLPSGTTAQRPSAPTTGEWRFNTDDRLVEYYDGTYWVQIETDAIPPISPSEFFNVNTYAGNGVARNIDGKFNEAITFNGTSDGVELPPILPANSTASSSATLWFKIEDTTGAQATLIEAWDGTTGNDGAWAVWRDTGNVLRLGNYYLNGSNIGTDGTTNVADGNWHFIAVVFDYSGATLSLYLDGNSTPEVQFTGLTPGTVNIFSGSSALGYQIQSGPFRYFPGSMDQFRIYSDALTTSEISYIYTNENTSTAAELNPSGFPTNCVAAYQFNGDLSEVSGAYGAFDNGLDIGYIGFDFAPEFVWLKGRDSARDHRVFDFVRGATKGLYTNLTNAEFTENSLTAFNTNGFTLDTAGNQNVSAEDYVAWTFKAGGAAVSNTAGDIASQVSANESSGFSIATYTGNGTTNQTVGNGLTGGVDLIIIKNLSNTDDWAVFSSQLGGDFLELARDTGKASNTALGYTINSTTVTLAPSATPHDMINANLENYVMYSWKSIAGYSAVGTYTGTGVEYGNYIYTTDDGTATGSNGFEPAFIIIKRTDSTANWRMFDNKRSPRNPRDQELYPNLNNAESLFVTVDFCKNGFELRTTDSNTNGSGATYLYFVVAGDPDTSTPTADNSFQPALYTGTGGASIAPLTFKPDLVWVKARDTATKWNVWYDSMRGNLSMLSSNSTNAATDYPATSPGGVYCTPNGYNVGSNSAGDLNTNTENYASWSWKAGGVATINNDGTQTASVSANVAGGFSIVRFTSGSGASTAGHGLGVAPTLFMFFRLDSAETRWTYTTVIDGSNDYLELNSNAAKVDATESAPTSSVIYQPTTAANKVYTVYCFANITGYQQVGYYAGVSTGTRTHITGFEPSFVMIKRTNTTGEWCVYDSQRRSPASSIIFANLDDAEYTIDNSNLYVTFVAGGAGVGGFTTPGTASEIDGSGDSFIYLAVK